MGNETGDAGGHALQRLTRRADPDGQQRQEHRPEEGARDGAQTADDDHREIGDARFEREPLPGHDRPVVGEERTGEADEERRGRERQELVPEDVDPHGARRDVLIPDGDEGAPGARAEEVRGEERRRARRRGSEPIEREVGVEPHVEDAGRGQDERLRAARQSRPVREQPLDDLLRRERSDRQVQSLQAERGESEEDADRRGEDAGEGDADPPREPETQREQPRRVGAHGHEGALPERDLARVAREDVQADRADRRDRDLVGEVQPVGRREERKGHDRRDEEGQTHTLGRGRTQTHVGFVARMVDTGAHASTPAR